MKEKLYKIMSWPEIEAIVYGDTNNPQDILGRHYASAYTLFQTFIPDAAAVNVCFGGDKKKLKMELADDAGFFAVAVLGKEVRDYLYEVTFKDGTKKNICDPYIFNPKMEKDEALSWTKGTSLHAYKYMGASVATYNGIEGVRFRVWAPNAKRVSVVGDFNNWNSISHQMIFDEKTGVFSLFVPGITNGAKYRYEVCTKGDECTQKLDPYALAFDADDRCSVVASVPEFEWADSLYIESRHLTDTNIINILELDNVLWAESDKPLSESIINDLCKYVKDTLYTHVLVNIVDDRFYCLNNKIDSEMLMRLVDSMHKLGKGVLIKWNPCYFSPDEDGIKVFDGTYLYGHLDERRRYNAMFGYNFNYGREQVDDFLVSNLVYWIEEFHLDGIHVDDLASVLRLDYGRNGGDFVANIYGGSENLEAINFIKKINTLIHNRYKGCISTTKETSMYPKVTYEVKEDGLGFDFIWDNGFGEDYLEFSKSENLNINKLTDSMAYAYSENYILTISKDDVIAANDYDIDRVNMGAGYFDCMPYNDNQKKSFKRATLAYFMSHPGKKLVYIGQDEKNISTKLNSLYCSMPAFYELDRYKEGFEWVYAFNNGSGVISFIRKGDIFRDNVLVICNFSLNEYSDYKLGVPYEGKYKCFFNSEDKAYGGEYKLSAKAIDTVTEDYDGKECTISVKLPAMSVSFYSYEPYSEEEFLKIAKKKAALIKKELEKEVERRTKELESEAKRKAKEYNSLTKKSQKN